MFLGFFYVAGTVIGVLWGTGEEDVFIALTLQTSKEIGQSQLIATLGRM